MGREELTDGGSAPSRPTPPRPGGAARYGDRFRPASSALALDQPAAQGDLVGSGTERPPRTWPTWLSRGAAALGLAATAVIAVGLGDLESSPPQSAGDPSAQRALDMDRTQAPALAEPPSVATLVSSRIEQGVWDHGRFTLDQDRFGFKVTMGAVSVAAINVEVLSETSTPCTFLGGPPRFGSVYWC